MARYFLLTDGGAVRGKIKEFHALWQRGFKFFEGEGAVFVANPPD